MRFRSARFSVAFVPLLGAACNDYAIIKQPLRETFYQDDREKVDVLFVIDDSPSMLEEAEPIQTAASALLASLVRLEVDTRVRFVSTSSALLIDWTPIDAADQVTTLASSLSVPAEGQHDEPGLEVAAAFSGSVRDDAVLHVVIVSDEDDRSPDPVADYTALLAASTAGGVRIHPITGDLPAGCARDGLAADPSPRYRQAAEDTDGTPQSICSATLGEDLDRLSFALSGLRARFPLSSIPDTGSLVVWVDGALIERSPHHGWTWAPEDNALVFDGFAVPPPGSRIEVEYDVGRPGGTEGLARLPDDTGSPATTEAP